MRRFIFSSYSGATSPESKGVNMNKKWKIIGIALMLCLVPLQALAKAKEEINWTPLVESPAANFFYDEASLESIPKKVAPKDIVVMVAKTKVETKDETFLKLLAESDKKFQSKKHKLESIIMHMELNLADKTYKCTAMELFTTKGKLLEERKIKTKFLPVPKNTFVAKLYDLVEAKVKVMQQPNVGGTEKTTGLLEMSTVAEAIEAGRKDN